MGFFISPSLILLSLFCILSAAHASPLDLAGHVTSAIKIRFDGPMMNNTPDAVETHFNAPTVLWLSFSLLFGACMTVGGFHDRVKRPSAGVGIGLAAATLVWAILLNTIPLRDSDLTLCLIALSVFLCGFGLHLYFKWPVSQTAGTYILAITGGLTVGIRIMILKSNLLIPEPKLFPLVWGIIGICGSPGVIVEWRAKNVKIKRIIWIFCCTSTGTFLLSLGVDMCMHKQGGMSHGLRFLFDRKPSHDIVMGGYFALHSTQFIIGASLGIVLPIFADIQYCISQVQPWCKTPCWVDLVAPEKLYRNRYNGTT